MGWSPFNAVKKFVKKVVSNPTTWLTGGANLQFDLLDKTLQRYGGDIFGNKQQEINNDIAKDNNLLQKNTYNFNKDLATKTYELNKDVIYNGSQIKSSDMAKAGLNPLAGVNTSPSTISASNVSSPSLSQPDLVAQTGLQKIQTVAGLALQAKQLQSSIVSSAVNNAATKAQTRYQQLVNDYFEKHGVLPTQQNEWIAQILPLLEKLNAPSSGQQLVDAVADKVSGISQKGAASAQASADRFSSMPDLSKLTKSAYIKLAFTGAGMKDFPANEKGFLDWCKTKNGQQVLKGNNRNIIRDFFFWIER